MPGQATSTFVARPLQIYATAMVVSSTSTISPVGHQEPMQRYHSNDLVHIIDVTWRQMSTRVKRGGLSWEDLGIITATVRAKRRSRSHHLNSQDDNRSRYAPHSSPSWSTACRFWPGYRTCAIRLMSLSMSIRDPLVNLRLRPH